MPEIIQLGLAEAGGHPISPDLRHMCVPLLFPKFLRPGGPCGSHGNSGVPGQSIYIIAHLLSCVLEKNSPTNLDFTENIV